MLRLPDLRQMHSPRTSGTPLGAEDTHDELVIHRAYQTYEAAGAKGAAVRSFVFEFSQRNPGETEWFSGYKVVRLLRLTRVPRYLRSGAAAGGLNLVFQQQRDVLAALREQQVLFLNLIAHAPGMPLAFCYGVQAVGTSLEAATAQADEAFEVLKFQLSGTYQQLQVSPLTVSEGEQISRYQAEWRHVAMARGRPLPNGGSIPMMGDLDGNRTEAANNQLEAFIRGMSGSSFMMTLVTVPLSPAEMTMAWRNLSTKLSEVRSDQQGARSVSAGVALPLAMGTSYGQSHGDSSSTGSAEAVGDSYGVSQSMSDSVSVGESVGVSESRTSGSSLSVSQGASESLSQSVGESESLSEGASESHSQSATQSAGDSMSASRSVASGENLSQGQSVQEGASESNSFSAGESQSMGQSASRSSGLSTSETASLGHSLSEGRSASSTLSENFSASLSGAEGWSRSASSSVSEAFGLGSSKTDAINGSDSSSGGSSVSGGLLGLGSQMSEGFSKMFGTNFGASDSVNNSLTAAGSDTSGQTGTRSSSFGEGASQGESLGMSNTSGLSRTNSVGMSETQALSEGLSSTVGRTISEGQSAGRSFAMGESLSRGASLSQGVSEGMGASRGASLGEGVSSGQSVTAGQGLSRGIGASSGISASESAGVSESATSGASRSSSESSGRTISAGESAGIASNRSLSDAYMTAMSKTASHTGSLGAVPSVGVSISRQTFDESKRLLGDVLESQMRRFIEGMESGAFLYQCFITAPDRATLRGAASLMKSAFWGSGSDTRIAQPFHVVTDIPDADERERLLDHARCFTSYRRREPVTEEISPFLYSSYITPSELSAMTHPPTANALGLEAQFDSIPVLSMPAGREDRELYLGQLINGERGEVSEQRFSLDVDEVTHMLVTGVTGSGKALAVDTPIATPNGWTTMGELAVGDTIFGSGGRPTAVTYATDVMDDHDCYRVTFDDGSSIVADAAHLWDVSTYLSRFSTSRAAARRRTGVRGQAERHAAQAKHSRLVSHTHDGDSATIQRITGLLQVPEAVVRRGAKVSGAVGTTAVLMEQSYDGAIVTKRKVVDTYDVAAVATHVADELEARAEAHAVAPLSTLLTTEQMAARLARNDGARNLAIHAAGALRTPDADLDVDPYVLGYWLGDGSTNYCHLTVGDDDITATTAQLHARGYELVHMNDLRYRLVDPRWAAALDAGVARVRDGWTASSAARQAGCDPTTLLDRLAALGITPGTRRLPPGTAAAPKVRRVARQLSDIGVLGDKHIPAAYLRGSREQRLELLRGIVDSDGYVASQGHVVIELTNRRLMDGVLELVRSLGFIPSWRQGVAQYNGVVTGDTWAVSFTTDQLVASLPRKVARLPKSTRSTNVWRYIDTIEPVASVAVRCIEVAADNHLFLAGDSLVPTHNTTTLLRHLTELTQVTRDVIVEDPTTGLLEQTTARASILGLDWMRNMRNLASVVPDDRFRFYSVSRPELGAFRWNLLAIPAAGMPAAEWLNQQADNMTASWNLGEFGRSLIAEFIGDLYAANRLEPYVLLDAHVDDGGNVLRDGIHLAAVDRAELPEGAIQVGSDGREYANVYSCPDLSRLVSIENLATLVMSRVEMMRDPDAARLYGTAMRDRLQSLWRRISYFAPGGVLTEMFGCDESLTVRSTLSVTDLVQPDEGLVVIVETDGLDMANRRLILGSVLLAVYRFGLAHGEGIFDHGGQGPGLHLILEEAHELFGSGGEDSDAFSVSTRNSLYESLFRRARALGARLVAVAQNPGELPVAVTSNTSTVLIHRMYDEGDRKRAFDLLNWSNQIGQQQREWRFLGEMPVGWCIARLHARTDYLESAPVLIRAEPAPLEQLTDADMAERAARLGTGR
jgi:hypothetical protein